VGVSRNLDTHGRFSQEKTVLHGRFNFSATGNLLQVAAMTRVAINDALWGTSLALQCGLLALVFARGIARRLPCFTLLLGFYPARSAGLFLLFGRVAPGDYAGLNDWLSLAGLLLQLVVAVEVGWKLFKMPGRRWGYAAWGVPVAAWVGTVALEFVLPGNSPVPPDRLQMFCSLTMVLLWVWAAVERAPRLVWRVAAGLAAYGAVDLMATAGKAVAAMHRDAPMFAGWSYASSGVYIGVVVFWIFALKSERGGLALD
jgi:hypothetical protein